MVIDNTSKLSINSFKITKNLQPKDDIAKTIKNLDPSKIHGYDMLSICML